MFRTFFLSLPILFAFSTHLAKAEECKIEIEGNDQMKFNKKELTVDASCKEITLTLKHVGKLDKKLMGHNWVVFETKNKDAVMKSANTAGEAKDYHPDSKLMIAATKTIGGGETTEVKFSGKKLKKGGDYTFVCTFPGHYALMVGKLIVK